MALQKITSKLEELFGIDVRALALMRIAFGLVVFSDLVGRSLSLTAHYTDAGLLPRSYAIELISQYSICAHFMNGTKEFQIAMFLIAWVAALCVFLYSYIS